MAAFALLSEIPYDLAVSGRVFDLGRQNLLLSLTVCLVMLYGLRMFSAGKGAQAAIVLAAALWVSLLRGQFGICLVLLCAVYYLLQNRPRARLLLGDLIGLLYVTAPISHFVLARYSGRRGGSWNKWLFYAMYPAHLVILGGIAWVCRG